MHHDLETGRLAAARWSRANLDVTVTVLVSSHSLAMTLSMGNTKESEVLPASIGCQSGCLICYHLLKHPSTPQNRLTTPSQR